MSTEDKKPRGRPRKYAEDGTLIELQPPADNKYQVYQEYYREYQTRYRNANRDRINEISRAHAKRKNKVNKQLKEPNE